MPAGMLGQVADFGRVHPQDHGPGNIGGKHIPRRDQDVCTVGGPVDRRAPVESVDPVDQGQRRGQLLAEALDKAVQGDLGMMAENLGAAGQAPLQVFEAEGNPRGIMCFQNRQVDQEVRLQDRGGDIK